MNILSQEFLAKLRILSLSCVSFDLKLHAVSAQVKTLRTYSWKILLYDKMVEMVKRKNPRKTPTVLGRRSKRYEQSKLLSTH